ncbi:MAG: GNAT family N-acetyltransferase [Rhodospirillaceae bacterium]|jgi:lipid II:glycine glycyltransferase (peptidoglycan interpeptide bridge formation enzyme)|nr:GNAT family N-acetyltransferase [Rhodospirillales bacterium]MBT4702419.1 GNAT family N-acetyltransferase [Rhodospirillaceae bacterium]MBT5036722.1 GNAT family N-acetyltransferase [Rhodospirillaceae bacterium]MBT6219642.1 GNAT family N-acetyltransferase [Rhodospirillaceae bacterium]MBT6360954.1 GNAT family N-acetyltransferase [Rhodospirillaceae bacterium]
MIGVMVTFEAQNFSQDTWSDLVSGFDGLSLLQTWEHAEAKAQTGPWGVERGIFKIDGKTVGAAQAMIRTLPLIGGGLVWINRGPLWHSADIPFADLVAALKATYVDQRGFYLRIAPPLPGDDSFIPAATLTDEPGWASAMLDLSPSVEDLRQGLKQKWRNGLNKAERSGFEVEEGTDDALFTAFLDAHTEFSDAKGFATSVTPDFLRSLNDLSLEVGKLYTLVARLDGKVAGSALIARYGDTGEYLAGNTTDAGRRLNAGQLLLWRAVETLKHQGHRRFDLGGMDEVLTPKGIYRFKEGLGGIPYRLAPELELGGDSLRGRLVRWRVNKARAGS